MRSVKRIVGITLMILIIVLVSSVLVNNLYIKPLSDLWQTMEDNSRKIITIYMDADFNIRVMNNVLGQLSSVESIEDEKHDKILNSYNNSYDKLMEDLNEIYNMNYENIQTLKRIDGYFLYNTFFKKENLNSELDMIDDGINRAKIEILELEELDYENQYEKLNLTYKSYLDLKPTISSFSEKLEETTTDARNDLTNIFNIILIFLIIVVILIIYFMDRIIKKDTEYMMYSLKMLSNNNYNISMLPKLKIRFKEEGLIKKNVEDIFREQEFIKEIKEILSREYLLDEIIDKLLHLVKDSMNTNRIGIAYIDYKKEKIVAEYGSFDYGKVLLGPGFSVSMNETSLSNMIETKKGIITNSISEELKKRPNSPSLLLLEKEEIQSNLIIPLILNDIVFGYLFFSSLEENNYSESDLKLGVKIAQEISGILNTTYLTKKIFISMTNAFANLVEKKDNDTGDHILRMTHYSRIIAEGLMNHKNPEYDVNQSFVNDIINYAPVHDIGKVGIPDSILKKPGKLTIEERKIMETHAIIGGDILNEVEEDLKIFDRDFFKMAMEIARGHHEKWDGSGYPRGLSASDIPLEARIVAIADVFDALSSKRVYKDDFGFEKSVEIINEGSGKHFDPELVKVFNNSLEEIEIIYEENKVNKKEPAE